MSIDQIALPGEWLLTAAGIAAGSVALPTIGLFAARVVRRRSLPARHGVLLGTLLVVALLPALIPWLQSQGLGWRWGSVAQLSLSSPPSNVTRATVSPVSYDRESMLELPANGSLQADGLTVAEVLSRYGHSPSKAAPAPQAASAQAPAAPVARDVGPMIRQAASWLCLAWLTGTGVSLWCAVRTGRALRIATRRAARVDDARLVELLAECARDAGLRRAPPLVRCDGFAVPCVYGLLRPTIILPADLCNAADLTTLRPVLLHELAHIRRRDLWVGLVQRLVTTGYWWNPLVYAVNNRLAEDREDLCDNYVLLHISDPRRYAETLVELASQAAAARLVPSMGLFNRSPNRLSGRIQRILQEDRPMATRLGSASKLLLVVFVFALGAGSMLFVICLPEMLPDARAAARQYLDGDVPESSVATVSLAQYPAPLREPQVHSTAVDVAAGVAPESMPVLSSAADWSVDSATVPAITPEPPGDWSRNSDAPPLLADSEPAPPVQEAPLDGSDVPVIGNPFTLPEPPAAPVQDTWGTPVVDSPLALSESPAPAVQDASPDAFAAPVIDNTATAREPSVLDPFSPPSGAPLPEPIPILDPLVDATSITPDAIVPSARQKALVLVELTANPDGTVKQVRYLTEDLGNDDEAFKKLEQQIIAWAGQLAGSDLTVQIVGDPQLRFEHVSRVMKICSPLVTRVVLAKAEAVQTVELVIGFVRDRQGQRVNSTPVLFWGEDLVPINQLGEQINSWAKGLPLVETNVLIRVDFEVKADVVEEVIRHARNAGFEQFSLKTIDPPAASPTRDLTGLVINVDNATRTVFVSIGDDDGLRPGQALNVERPRQSGDKAGPVIARVEVARVSSDSAECRILEEDLLQPIKVGDTVWTTTSQAAPIEFTDPTRN